jgi:hypothetical protein
MLPHRPISWGICEQYLAYYFKLNIQFYRYHSKARFSIIRKGFVQTSDFGGKENGYILHYV